MKEFNCDIHIVGGALTGLLTAYCASILGYKIVVSEKKKIALYNKKSPADKRTTAIAEGSKAFLDSKGLWRIIKSFAEPIKKIKVIDTAVNSNLDFYNPKPKSNLGYIVKNSKLINILIKELKKKNNVNFLTGTNLISIYYDDENIVSCSEYYRIKSKLLIAADGKNSTVRRILGAKIFKKNYKEKALVVNFFHERSHNNIAYEFFLKTGPLAILPMQKEKNQNQSSLIWSNKSGLVDMIGSSDFNNEYVREILNEKIYQYLGVVKNINSIQTFPLSAHINEKFYDNRTIYVGDSAHSIHPIAGQGWNLGLRDVKSLTQLLREAKDNDSEIGTKSFCKKYNNSCYYDAYTLFEITDKLDWIFKKHKPHYKFIKNIGFKTINNNKELKEKIAEFAMGF